MSYIIYGADVSGLVRKETSIIPFLESEEFKNIDPDGYDSWMEYKENNHSLNFWDWVRNWDVGFANGFAGFLANIINRESNLDLNSDGYYLGIYLNLPWRFSEEMRQLDEEKFHAIIQEKLRFFTGSVEWGYFTV